MEYFVNPQDKEVTIKLNSCFDVSGYELFKSICTENMTENNHFVVDFENTEFMDSSALGMLLLLREHTRGDKSRVTFINVKKSARKILEIAQFHQLFNIQS